MDYIQFSFLNIHFPLLRNELFFHKVSSTYIYFPRPGPPSHPGVTAFASRATCPHVAIFYKKAAQYIEPPLYNFWGNPQSPFLYRNLYFLNYFIFSEGTTILIGIRETSFLDLLFFNLEYEEYARTISSRSSS